MLAGVQRSAMSRLKSSLQNRQNNATADNLPVNLAKPPIVSGSGNFFRQAGSWIFIILEIVSKTILSCSNRPVILVQFLWFVSVIVLAPERMLAVRTVLSLNQEMSAKVHRRLQEQTYQRSMVAVNVTNWRQRSWWLLIGQRSMTVSFAYFMYFS